MVYYQGRSRNIQMIIEIIQKLNKDDNYIF